MLQSGQKVDRYIVEGKVGEGGMATVYRVRHETLGTMHALKVLEISSRDVRERLVREGRLQAGLEHDHVVRVTDILSVEGMPALLMEFVRGPTLDSWMLRYKPTLDESLALFRGVCLGLGYAHSRGVVHRDLKPANVLLAVEAGRVVPKVTDFGLAKELKGREQAGRTRHGTTMGTPEFMAPEQIRDAGGVDRRADLWSLGCLLYRLVCGVIPFQADDLIELFAAISNADYVPSQRLAPGVPARIHEAIDGLVKVAPGERFGDCSAVLRFLEQPSAAQDRTFVPVPPMPETQLPSWLSGRTPGEETARAAAEQQLLQLPKLDRAEFSPWNAAPSASSPTVAPPDVSEEATVEAAPPPQRSGRWAVATLVAAVSAGLVVIGGGGIGLVLIAALAGSHPVAVPVHSDPREPDPSPVAPEPARPVVPVPAPSPSTPSTSAPSTPPASPPPARAEVSFTGADELWLVSLADRAEVRDLRRVPPGRYRIVARFPGAVESGAGEVVIEPGEGRVVLACGAAMARCVRK